MNDNFDIEKMVEAAVRKAEEKRNGHATGPDPDLVEMNAQYAIVKLSGKTRVVEFEDSPAFPGCLVPVYSTVADFCLFHNKHKKIVTLGTESKQTGIGKWWINHDERKQYNGVVYAPLQDTPGKLNLWKDFVCEPIAGDCSLYLDHLRDNICSGNAKHYDYLLNKMAYAVQHPDRLGEVATVLRGPEGVGKGVAIDTFGYLFGSHYRHVVHGKHLIGNFNSHLQHCSVLYANEAFFAGDRAHEAVLKALITEKTILIEPKGIDPYTVRNYVHLFMSSNSEWVVPAGPVARRYFVLDVAVHKMQDHDYFAAIAKQMDEGGYAALLHFLLNREISGFNVRDVPQTSALAEQKQFSRRGVDQLVETLAHDGDLPSAHYDLPYVAVTTGESQRKGFYAAARELVPDLRRSSPAVIVNELKKNWGCKRWRRSNQRGIEFPPLKKLREMFDKRHGPQQWLEPDDWQVPPSGDTF